MLKKSNQKIDVKYIKVPTPAVVLTALLLVGLAFYSGFAWNKLKGDTTATATTKITFAPKKTDKTELKFFVMSFCPYGNQIEDVIRPVVDLLGDKADIVPQYIFDKIDNIDTYCKSRSGDPTQCAVYVQNKYFTTEAECQKTISQNLTKCKDTSAYIKAPNGIYYSSLHGRQEATQDVREICAWKIASDKSQWWNFVGNVNKNCTADNADSCWEKEAKSAGFDTAAITDCFNKEGIALIEKELELTSRYQVQGSPTLLINESDFPPETAYSQDGKGSLKIGKKVATQDRYRTPNVLKEAICAGFKNPPKECNTVLPDPEGVAAPAAGGC